MSERLSLIDNNVEYDLLTMKKLAYLDLQRVQELEKLIHRCTRRHRTMVDRCSHSADYLFAGVSSSKVTHFIHVVRDDITGKLIRLIIGIHHSPNVPCSLLVSKPLPNFDPLMDSFSC